MSCSEARHVVYRTGATNSCNITCHRVSRVCYSNRSLGVSHWESAFAPGENRGFVLAESALIFQSGAQNQHFTQSDVCVKIGL
jgi:hypothetical protein